jgi:outer membrane protein assembly factor BamB
VSDGKFIWVFFSTGIVACYDPEGTRQWISAFDLPLTTSYGRTASPVLVGDRLLVHFGPLVCLQARTGKLLWKNDQAEASYGTPVRARIRDADVLVTPKGHVVRVSDGKILASDLGNCMYASPVVQDNVVYYIEGNTTAVRLPDQVADQIRCQELWSGNLDGEFYASPLVNGDRIYTVDRAGNYFVLDAKTGKTILNKALPFSPTENANVYPSVCLAGKSLFVGNDAGEMLVLEPTEKGTALATNSLPRGSGASLLLSGKRMFIRGGKLLYCLGAP